jgi:hypothetical protein
MNAKEQIQKVLIGNFCPIDDAGFYDWFCNKNQLEKKSIELYLKIIQIIYSEKINLEESEIMLKNNALLSGGQYDDFRFVDLTGQTIFCVIPESKNHKESEVWSKENAFQSPVVSGKWIDVIKFFLN